MKSTILVTSFRTFIKIPRLLKPVLFSLLAVVLAVLTARAETVTIYNERNDTIQVCVYNALVVLGGGKAGVRDGPPLACWVLLPKKSARWDRARTFGYSLTVSKPNTDITLCESAAVPNGPALTIGPACQLTAVAPKPPPKPAPKPTPAAPKPVSPKPVAPRPVPPIAVKPKPAPPAAPKPTPIHYPEVTLIGPGRIWKVGSKQEPPLPAKADENVEFVNKTSETVKVCFYKSSAITDVYPTSCSDIVSGDQLGLNRGGETYPLHVRVFRPGIIDTLLCTGQFVGNPLWVYIDGGCTVRVVERIQHLRSWQQQDTHLVVCNRFAKERVRFAIGSFVELVRGGADRVLDVEGWYLVLPGECKSFSMTFRLRKVRDPSWTAGAGQPPYAFYIYGETVDAFWGGDADDPEYCAQQEGNFHYSVDPAKSGECAGPNQKRIRFRPVTSKSESIRNPLSHYYWNF